MLLTMNSKELGKFLECESDNTILKCQYCIVSARIRLRTHEGMDNAVNCQHYLFPNHNVLSADSEMMDDVYINQIESHEALLANIILISEKAHKNVIFLCTKNEEKLGFMSVLRAYIKSHFGCPIYDYNYYTMCSDEDLDDYDSDDVVQKCERIVERDANQKYFEKLQTEDGQESIIQEIKKMRKKELKKKCRQENLYTQGMSKEDMVNILTAFM